jgi:ubiquitin carboxyl-terminal hydrolase L3
MHDRARVLEEDLELEAVYSSVAMQGDTEAPVNREDEVDFHYVCFVKSHKNNHLYEMDGDRGGPIDRSHLEPDEDVLSEQGLDLIRAYIGQEPESVNFSLLVLAPSQEGQD